MSDWLPKGDTRNKKTGGKKLEKIRVFPRLQLCFTRALSCASFGRIV
jgi:hypothetical protein